jgi:hypothetical protein
LILPETPATSGDAPRAALSQCQLEFQKRQSDFIDNAGDPVSLQRAFEHAESVAMTLPQLLTRAVKAQTGDHNARYVFPLGQWSLEKIEDRRSFVLTLKTADGFQVSFRISLGTCQAFGWTLHQEAAEAVEMVKPTLH